MKRWRLFLDDDRWPPGNIDESWDWVIARTVDDAIWYVKSYGTPLHIAFDHDLGHKKMTGMDFAVWFSDHVLDGTLQLPEGFGWSVHSFNTVGAKNIANRMVWLMEEYLDLT